MAKLNVNQNKFEYLWKLPEVDVERRGKGRRGRGAEQSKLSVCAKFVNWKIENNEWHAHTHKSLNFAATNTILHWTVNTFLPPPPYSPAFPKFPLCLRWGFEVKQQQQHVESLLANFVPLSVALCVCVCVSVGVCLRVSMWLTHLEACRQRSARSAQVFKFISFSQGYIARSPSAQLPFACQENNVFFLVQKLKSYFHDRK